MTRYEIEAILVLLFSIGGTVLAIGFVMWAVARVAG